MTNNPIAAIMLKRAKQCYERNLEMAERYSHHRELEEKFLSQAIKAETEIRKLLGYA